MLTRLKELWADTPHQLQAVIIGFSIGTGSAAVHYFSEPSNCMAWGCIRHVFPTFLASGLASAKAFLMLPSNAQTQVAAQNQATPPKS